MQSPFFQLTYAFPGQVHVFSDLGERLRFQVVKPEASFDNMPFFWFKLAEKVFQVRGMRSQSALHRRA